MLDYAFLDTNEEISNQKKTKKEKKKAPCVITEHTQWFFAATGCSIMLWAGPKEREQWSEVASCANANNHLRNIRILLRNIETHQYGPCTLFLRSVSYIRCALIRVQGSGFTLHRCSHTKVHALSMDVQYGISTVHLMNETRMNSNGDTL